MYTKHFLLAPILFFSSCAYHTGSMSSSTSISNGHFKVLGYAVGTSEVNKFLGFGGLSKDGLVQEAKNDLYDKYKLDSAQVFGNVTVDFKTTFIFPFTKTQVFVGADVIDFYPERNATMKSPIANEHKTGYIKLGNQTKVSGYRVGDTVSATVSGKSVTGVIAKFKGKWAYVSQENNKKVWVPINALSK